MKVSVIIVSYNTKDILHQCLRRLYENPPGTIFEVILIDNASTDGSVEMAKKNFASVNVIVNKENRGYAAANNQGIRACHGEYILLLNSDTLIINDKTKNGLDKLLAFMQEHPEAAIAGPQLIDTEGNLQLSTGIFPGMTNTIVQKLLKLMLGWKGTRQWVIARFNKTRTVDWISGACLMIRRSIVEKAGLLDENFFMYFEDVDWCYRAQEMEGKIYYYPQVKIVHNSGRSREKNKEDVLLEYQRSQFYYYKKHKGKMALALLKILQCLRIIIALSILKISCFFSRNTRLKKRLYYYTKFFYLLGENAYRH